MGENGRKHFMMHRCWCQDGINLNSVPISRKFTSPGKLQFSMSLPWQQGKHASMQLIVCLRDNLLWHRVGLVLLGVFVFFLAPHSILLSIGGGGGGVPKITSTKKGLLK